MNDYTCPTCGRSLSAHCSSRDCRWYRCTKCRVVWAPSAARVCSRVDCPETPRLGAHWRHYAMSVADVA